LKIYKHFPHELFAGVGGREEEGARALLEEEAEEAARTLWEEESTECLFGLKGR